MDKPEHEAQWRREAPKIPYGKCWCGCGTDTPIATRTDLGKGRVKGAPSRYVAGHTRSTVIGKTHARQVSEYRTNWSEQRPDIPYGQCWCGCGEFTPVAPQSSSVKGYVRGEPKQWCRGHSTRQERPIFIEDRGYETPCHIWYGAKTSGKAQPNHPYGTIRVGRKIRKVHRVIYEENRGPIPDKFEIHHLCDQTLCVNPDHLQPLSKSEHFKTYVKNFSASGLKARWG